MTQSRCLRPIALASAFALAVLALGAPGSARAQDDTVDESNSILNLERRIWRGVVNGLGLRSSDDPVIEYRERSPLVVPPTRDLPPPQSKSVAKNPSWPNDPDIARRRGTNTKKTLGNVDMSRELDRQSRPATPQELNAPGGSASTSAPTPGDTGRAPQLTPSELGYYGGLFSLRAWGFGGYNDEVGTFTKEPERSALTAPPSGYQTPSPAEPYGTTRRIERTAPKQFDPAGRQ